jgi:hypothetical protein
MPQELSRRGSTSVRDIRELVEIARREKRTLVINVGKGPGGGVVVVATGKRANLLRKLADEYSEV